MSSVLETQMEALKAALATMFPERVVTRDLFDYAARDSEEVKKGIYTVLSATEDDYVNLLGRSATFGTRGIRILAQIQVEDEKTPSEVENAEGVMIDEIKQFVNAVPSELGDLLLVRLQQSAQMDYPYGWVLFELTNQEG